MAEPEGSREMSAGRGLEESQVENSLSRYLVAIKESVGKQVMAALSQSFQGSKGGREVTAAVAQGSRVAQA